MATFSNTTKNTGTVSNVSKSGVGSVTTVIGMATGLIAPPTYATEIAISAGGEISWSNQNKN